MLGHATQAEDVEHIEPLSWTTKHYKWLNGEQTSYKKIMLQSRLYPKHNFSIQKSSSNHLGNENLGTRYINQLTTK
jgi:hypothetical protein